MASVEHSIEWKAIDVSGRLGSFYDQSSDAFVGYCSLQNLENSKDSINSACQILRCTHINNAIDVLKAIKFHDTLLQSILFGLVKPSGISSVINYNGPIDEYTLFLYYTYEHRQEKLGAITDRKAHRTISPPSDLNNATHMVTEITWGFEILCIIQVLRTESVDQIENLLYKIWNQPFDLDKRSELINNEKHEINKLSNVAIFGSETCTKNSNTLSLLTVLDQLKKWQDNKNFHVPLLYRMHSLEYLFKNQSLSKPYFLSNDDSSKIEQIGIMIIQLDNRLKKLQQLFKNRFNDCDNLIYDLWPHDIPDRLGILLSQYDEYRTKLGNILVDVRRGKGKSMDMTNMISDQRYSSLKKTAIDNFHKDVEQWLEKGKLIKRLQDENITYFNVHKILQHSNDVATIEDIDETLKSRFSTSDHPVIVWYSSDQLKREKSDRWNRIREDIIAKRQNSNDHISLIYVDFTHYQLVLKDFIVKDLPIQPLSNSPRKNPRAHPLPPIPQDKTPLTSSPQAETKPSRVTEFNVLLMGETGVGKSSFINAFVNYLVFDTLEQAEKNESIVLIPVSFLVTTGDQFNEFMVKFGDVDSNENHEHQGQSVTQQCKSYVFDLNETTRLRLIDTPGMGDTRGLVQDEKNLDHILTYVNNLSHLNAICLLFKPNNSQLNIFFRTCVKRVLTYLTPIFYKNVIFCFTNARSTFFAPGNTGLLLRQMMEKEYQNEIPFQKKNTFCFDSESFRYLAARKCHVNFDEFVIQESISSWTTSVTESIRLLRCIRKYEPYYLNDWQSIGKAVLEITMLSRPLMETLRSILYNWKLRETGIVNHRMILNSNFLGSTLCSNCVEKKLKFENRSNFPI
ncbi:unnamed protein product [Rotaria sp. Silwood1]|nr:unnamed protein product [Rotaria sp. Silwood1]